MTMRVNGERLRADLEQLATFGREPDGSISRPAFSPADVAARQWFADRARDAGLPAHVDGVLNVLVGEESGDPAVWTGSHLDSVPEGGMFDGALGSVAALECLRRLREERIPLRRGVRGVAFSDEEGAHLGFLGSNLLAGGLDGIDVRERQGAGGQPLAEVVAAAGGDLPAAAARDRLPAGAVHRFVELHIEQGPSLEATGTRIGAVTSIVGVGNASVRFDGRPDHAGTTPMRLRRDALRGAAAFLQAVPDLPAQLGLPDAVVSCGRVSVHPGADNVVPGTAVVFLDFRDPTMAGLQRLRQALERLGQRCAARFDLEASLSVASMTAPTETDPTTTEIIERQAKQLGLSTRRMPSGAAHDSQVMATCAPTGMIFVPSRGGRSHSRLESTAWEDVVNGANVLLMTLLDLVA